MEPTVDAPYGVVSETDQAQHGFLGDHRVIGELLKRDQVVVKCSGQTGSLAMIRTLPPDPGVEEVDRAIVDDGTPRPATVFVRRAQCRGQGQGQVFPVDEVLAGRMAPANVGVLRAGRVALVEHVVPALPEDEPVGVVHPIGPGRKVRLRPWSAWLFQRVPPYL